MSYTPHAWTTGELATASLANYWETEYDSVFDTTAKGFNCRVTVNSTDTTFTLPLTSYGTAANAATSGNVGNGMSRWRDTSGTACVDFGITTTGKGWIEVSNVSDLSAAQPLALNPRLGATPYAGHVSIGGDSTGDAHFEIITGTLTTALNSERLSAT